MVSSTRKIRVMVVDDSAVARTFLIKGLSAYPNIEVVAMPSTLWTPRRKFPAWPRM